MYPLILLFTFFSFSLTAQEVSEQKLKVLYTTLDPTSIAQHLAFYELYPHTYLGQQALHDALNLLSGGKTHSSLSFNSVSPLHSFIASLIALISRQGEEEMPLLTEEHLALIESISSHLPHKQLKGHKIQSEAEAWVLPPEETDLARGLFLSQFGGDLQKIRTYEAMIDLMALQILARLSPQLKPEDKIREINSHIFDEMGFRFPPHSLYAKDIDLYTFLPSVLDSRRGVCLGVSILYLCLAQRLNLTLEAVTPPGHIYVRYQNQDKTINIETTARGIHIDSKEYLGVNTRKLQVRTIKEVIGLAHFNQASVYWQHQQFDKALAAYKKAEPYLKEDKLLQELLGYSYISTGEVERGEALLQKIRKHTPDYAVCRETMADDYLNGYVDITGIQTIFGPVDEKRESVLAKKRALEEIVNRYPRFRAGHLHLAVAWLQLHRAGEALTALQDYYALNSEDPEVNYYLSILHAQRLDYNQAWFFLHQAETITAARDHKPKVLKELRRALLQCCPE